MFFNILSLSLSIPNGFHTITITPDSPLTAELDNQTVVFFLDKESHKRILISTSNVSIVDHLSKNMSFSRSLRVVQIMNRYFKVSLLNGNSEKINFWVLPLGICNNKLFSISAKYQMGFEFNFNSITSDFCFFPSQGGKSSVKLLHSSAQSRVDFMSHDDNKMVKTCRGRKKCSFSSKNPFFLKFHENVGSYFSVYFSHSLSNFDLHSADCGIDPISLLINDSFLDVKSPINIENTFCVNSYDRWIHFLLILINILLFGGLLMIMLNHCGVLRCNSIFGFPRSAFKFKMYRRTHNVENVHEEEILNTVEIRNEDLPDLQL